MVQARWTEYRIEYIFRSKITISIESEAKNFILIAKSRKSHTFEINLHLISGLIHPQIQHNNFESS